MQEYRRRKKEDAKDGKAAVLYTAKEGVLLGTVCPTLASLGQPGQGEPASG